MSPGDAFALLGVGVSVLASLGIHLGHVLLATLSKGLVSVQSLGRLEPVSLIGLQRIQGRVIGLLELVLVGV